MDPQEVRTISSEIVLILIGLLAATLIVIGPTWNRFLACSEQTSAEGRGMMFRGMLLALGIVSFFLIPIFIALWINPFRWFYELPYIWFIISFVATLVLFSIIFFWAIKWLWDKLRNRPAAERTKRPDFTKEIGVSFSLVFFISAMLLLILTMFAAIDAAIGVNVGLDQDNEILNFEFARAMIRLVPGLFFGGILFLGMSYSADIKKRSEIDTKDD